jgi:RIP metalloprotease RseP
MTDIHDRPVGDDVPTTASGGRLTEMAKSLESRGVGVDPDGDGGVPHAGFRLAALLGALALLGWWRPWMLVVVVALFLMITLHELGHFLMAKRAGMKVTEFFIFFGPKVWSFKRGETEYGIKCIPIGAYVKIIGMHNLEEVDPADEERTYRQKGFWDRFAVAVAGSAMHFILAVVLIFIALAVVGQPAGTIDHRDQQKAWQIGSVTAGAAASQAGLQPGDKVVSIAGDPIGVFEDLPKVAERHEGSTVPLTFVRDGVEQTTQIPLQASYQWFVARVGPGTGPDQAGLEPGDQVVQLGDLDVTPLKELEPKLLALEGTTVPVTFVRSDDQGDALAPQTTDVRVENLVLEGRRIFLGVSQETSDPERVPPLTALVRAPRDFLDVTWFSVQSLGRFFTPSGISDYASQVGSSRDDAALANRTSMETSATFIERGTGVPSENRIMSIVGLVDTGSTVGEIDPSALITLFAMINVFIGVFNLFPMLPFDGGHVVIAVYEKIQEKRLNRRRYFTDVGKLLPVTYVVVILLGLLFFSSLWLDLTNPIT